MNATKNSLASYFLRYYSEHSREPAFSDEHKLLSEAELISVLERDNASDELIEYSKHFPFADIITCYPQRPLWVYDRFRFNLSNRDSFGRFIPVSEEELLAAYRTCNFYRKSMGEPLLDIPMREIFATPDVGAFVEDIKIIPEFEIEHSPREDEYKKNKQIILDQHFAVRHKAMMKNLTHEKPSFIADAAFSKIGKGYD